MNSLLCALFGLGLVQASLAESPTESLRAFRTAAKAGQVEAAWKQIARFEGLPADYLAHLRQRHAEHVQRMVKGWDFAPLEEKISGPCAVVIVNEIKKDRPKAVDLDPIFLIRQGGQWKIMPGFSRWNLAKEVARDAVADLQKLEAWFKKRDAELKARRKEGQAPKKKP